MIHQGGELHLVAEGEKEQKKFVELFLSDFFVTERPTVQPTVVAEKKRKKHAFKKSCEVCGKEFKGLIGIGIHRSKMHPLAPTDLRPLPVQEG